jgi:hypothetical protein
MRMPSTATLQVPPATANFERAKGVQSVKARQHEIAEIVDDIGGSHGPFLITGPSFDVVETRQVLERLVSCG